MRQVAVSYSTVSIEAVTRLLETEYTFPAPFRVRLLRRGFNDHYVVSAGSKQYLLRIYLHRKYWIAGEGDIRFELELLRHLYRLGVPVSYALPRRNGDPLGRLAAPEGIRYFALFTWAAGTVPGEPTPEQHRITGETLARLHLAADRFQTDLPRYALDLGVLVDLPLERMRPYLEQSRPDDWAYLNDVADSIRRDLAEFTPPPGGYGFIHGDMHGGNCHFTPENKITLFDFDHGGFGWRAYDVATATLGEDQAAREAFLAGYESVRPLAAEERRVLPALARARMIWDDGDILAMVDLWGEAMVERRLTGLLKGLRAMAQ